MVAAITYDKELGISVHKLASSEMTGLKQEAKEEMDRTYREREGKMNQTEALRHLLKAFLLHTRRHRSTVCLCSQDGVYHTEEV